tara:strand:+ start:2734 stop:4851 length:2118 start_codon:yes stop_codon:yes gene_type:complete
MPADVNKSINISVKADMKNAINNIKSLPNVTAKEAAAMRKTLKREFKEAEKAAKKAEVAQKKAMQTTAREAKKAAAETRALKRQTAELGGAVSAAGDLLGEVSPELGGLATTASIAGVAVRDLGKAFLVMNPLVGSAIVAFGAVALAYAAFVAESAALEEAQKQTAEATKAFNETLKAQQTTVVSANAKVIDLSRTVADLKLEYRLLSGQITQFAVDQIKADQAVEKAKGSILEQSDAIRRDQIKTETAQKKILFSAREELRLIEKRSDSIGKNQAIAKQEIQLLMEQGKLSFSALKDLKARFNLSNEYVSALQQVNNEQQALNKLEQDNAKQIDDFLEAGAEQLINYEEQLDAVNELKESQRQQAEQDKANAEAERARNAARAEARKAQAKQDRETAKEKAEQDRQEAERQKELQQIYAAKSSAEASTEQLLLANKKTRISLIENEVERFDELSKLQSEGFDKRVSELEQEQVKNFLLAESVGAVEEAQKANAEIEEQIAAIREEEHLNEVMRSDQRKKMIEEETKQKIKDGFAIAGFYKQSAESASQLIQTVSGENREAALIAFRIAQAAALADIAMTTATKIMEVAPNPFAIGGIAALGALQAANVLAQSPPEKHMGGFISKGEDTRNVTVLTGEAVLDRRTVQRLGGEAGVNELQRSGSSSASQQVIVMNPFKHFDRYVSASTQRGGSLSKLSKKKALVGY